MRLPAADSSLWSRIAHVGVGFALCLALVLAVVGFRAATEDNDEAVNAEASTSLQSRVVNFAKSPAAAAGDVDGDRLTDAYVREPPYMRNDVGANCDLFVSSGNYFARLYIRPPYAWPLKQWTEQRMRWRARFFDKSTGLNVAVGNWIYRTLDGRERRYPTKFGGGPDVPAAMTTSKQYWQGSQYYEHPQADERPIKGMVDVGWQNPSTGQWLGHSMKAIWMISTANRSIGEGQEQAATTPLGIWAC